MKKNLKSIVLLTTLVFTMSATVTTKPVKAASLSEKLATELMIKSKTDYSNLLSAYNAVYALPTAWKTTRYNLIQAYNKIALKINLEAAKNIRQARSTKSMNDYKKALALVNYLPKGNAKTTYSKLLVDLSLQIANNNTTNNTTDNTAIEQQAVEQVAITKQNLTQENIDKLNSLISSLPQGSAKTTLSGIADELEKTLSIKTLEQQAVDQIKVLNTTLTQSSIDNLSSIIALLPNGSSKTNFTNSLAYYQKLLNQQSGTTTGGTTGGTTGTGTGTGTGTTDTGNTTVDVTLQIQQAVQQVAVTKLNLTQENIDKLNSLISSLPEGSSKTTLSGIANELKKTLSIKTLEQQAIDQITALKNGITQSSIDTLSTIVALLPSGSSKTNFTNSLAYYQGLLNQQSGNTTGGTTGGTTGTGTGTTDTGNVDNTVYKEIIPNSGVDDSILTSETLNSHYPNGGINFDSKILNEYLPYITVSNNTILIGDKPVIDTYNKYNSLQIKELLKGYLNSNTVNKMMLFNPFSQTTKKPVFDILIENCTANELDELGKCNFSYIFPTYENITNDNYGYKEAMKITDNTNLVMSIDCLSIESKRNVSVSSTYKEALKAENLDNSKLNDLKISLKSVFGDNYADYLYNLMVNDYTGESKQYHLEYENLKIDYNPTIYNGGACGGGTYSFTYKK